MTLFKNILKFKTSLLDIILVLVLDTSYPEFMDTKFSNAYLTMIGESKDTLSSGSAAERRNQR